MNPSGPLGEQLAAVGYLADPGIAHAAYLATTLRRPLLVEGEAGAGKTALAVALAEARGARLVRLQCHEGLDRSQALYDWDYAGQLLHLRALSVVQGPPQPQDAERELYSRRFLRPRPLLSALLAEVETVLLIDEIDRADPGFEALLLAFLGEQVVTVPELGRLRGERQPVTILTSNRTRELSAALRGRCLYHWIELPPPEVQRRIVGRRVPAAGEHLIADVVDALGRLRRFGLARPPGLAEAIDWTEALAVLGATGLAPVLAEATLGAVVKHQDDLGRLRGGALAELVVRRVG